MFLKLASDDEFGVKFCVGFCFLLFSLLVAIV